MKLNGGGLVKKLRELQFVKKFAKSHISLGFRLVALVLINTLNNKFDVLCDLVSVTIWHLHDRLNACKYMLTLFSNFMSFLFVYLSQHGILAGLSNIKR